MGQAGNVEEFINSAILWYDEPSPVADVDGHCRLLYDRAAGEVREWVRRVLLGELAHSGYSEAYVRLYLPLGDVEVKVVCGDMGGDSTVTAPELFHMPIGVMDYETYEAILYEEGNPVKLLYEFFSRIIHVLRITAPPSPHLLMQGDCLEAEGFRDILGLHRFEAVLYDLEGFLNGGCRLSQAGSVAAAEEAGNDKALRQGQEAMPQER